MSSELVKTQQERIEVLEKKVKELEGEKENWETKEKNFLEERRTAEDHRGYFLEMCEDLHEAIGNFETAFKDRHARGMSDLDK
jgi:hypothetical protein